MKTKNLFASLLIGLLIIAISTGCKKDTDPIETTTDISDVSDEAFAETVSDNIDNIIDEVFMDFSGYFKSGDDDGKIIGPCAIITHDTISIPHLITIDFGDTNCLCRDGRYRRGMILISYFGHYADSGSMKNANSEEYFVNDNQVIFDKSITNIGRNELGNLTWEIFSDGTIIFVEDKGGDFTWHSERTREWIEGEETHYRWDDVYLIRGNGNTVRPNGKSVTKEIVEPIMKKLNCRWFVSGTVKITPSNKPERLLDYGNGECDRFATVTINGKTFTIVLH
jgi:hypothetical protein